MGDEEAVLIIQAAYYGMRSRAEVRQKKKATAAAKKGRYDTFNVEEVRNELDRNQMLPQLPSLMKPFPQTRDPLGVPSALARPAAGGLPKPSGRLPARLAPLERAPGSLLTPISGVS